MKHCQINARSTYTATPEDTASGFEGCWGEQSEKLSGNAKL